MTALAKVAPDAATVLTKAVVRASDALEINQKVLARILGNSPSTVSRMVQGGALLRPNTGEWDAAAALIRVYRSLGGLLDGNDQLIKVWMTTFNHDLAATPVETLETGGGVYQLGAYLDAYRGRF
ncbi:antitoxin Xre-like helix-turn-helix domain-containing protein [Chitiniphilus shinanonensis]|uniref:antitoxin Xre-like helix-turn-helix domain-containing protein n=1 Tax=Chitiniphilus shinanonensis TaxID=553088 RepID=UPI0030253F38